MPTEPDVTATDDYKAQYETALKAGDKATRAHQGALEQLTTEKQAHDSTKASLMNLMAENTTLKATLGQKEVSLADLQGKVTTLEPFQVKATRLSVLMDEFPQLAPFEKDGLLPQGSTVEEIRASFTKFNERFNTLAKANGQDFVAGGKPAATPVSTEPKTSAVSAQTYLQQAIQAQATGNMKEYETLYSKFLVEKNKQDVPQ